MSSRASDSGQRITGIGVCPAEFQSSLVCSFLDMSEFLTVGMRIVTLCFQF